MIENNISDTWYEDFFQGITCEIWENAIPTEVTKQEVDFLLEELTLQKGQHILDIPCGFGRHAIEFSNRGFQVTGIDISETFITGLTEKVNSEKLTIQVIQADILSVQLPEMYSAAVCLGNSFGYFDHGKMSVFVEKVASSLTPGGRFIINSGMIAESILPNFQNYANNKSYTIGNITMEVTNTYKVEESFMISHLTYTQDGKKEEHSFKHYVFTLSEVKRLLQSFGLSTIATYSSTSKKEFNLEDQQIYIVAKKK